MHEITGAQCAGDWFKTRRSESSRWTQGGMLAVEADNKQKAGIKADDIGSNIDESSTALYDLGTGVTIRLILFLRGVLCPSGACGMILLF